MGPAAPRHVGSSQTRARTHLPCIGRQTLNHCATREVRQASFYMLISHTCIFLCEVVVHIFFPFIWWFDLLSLYWVVEFVRYLFCKYFSIYGLSINFLNYVFWYQKLLIKSNLSNFSRLWLLLTVSHLKNFCLPTGCKDILSFSRSFIILVFTIRFMMHLELVFGYDMR